MALNIATVMANIESSIHNLDGMNTYAYPPKSAVAPFAFVDFPQSLDYDLTMGRGNDRFEIRLYVCVSNTLDDQVWQSLCSYADTEGPASIKAAIENSVLDDSIRVTRCEFASIPVGGSSYAAAIFYLDIAA